MSVVKEMLVKLFPTGLAWRGKEYGTLNKLIEGISKEFERLKERNEKIGNAIFPYKTDFVKEWESEFTLPAAPDLTDDERRARLDGRWAMITLGSMQARNMEFIFSISGFDVVARPLAPGENPISYFVLDGQAYYGNLLAMYGRPRFGDGYRLAQPDNYLLINGGSFDFAEDPTDSAGLIPADPDFWGMFYVIEDVGGEPLQIPYRYKDVLFDVIYATKPTHMWCILRCNFLSSFIFAPEGAIPETRRIYWYYDGGSDTSIIYFIMDANDPAWAQPGSDYAGVAGASANYNRLVGRGDPVPDGNTFDGNTAPAGSPEYLKEIKITSLGTLTTDYEMVIQGTYVEHKFYLRNAGTDVATIEINGNVQSNGDLSGVLDIIEYDDTEKTNFDTDNPEGVVIL